MNRILRSMLVLVAVMSLTISIASVAFAHDGNGVQGTDHYPGAPLPLAGFVAASGHNAAVSVDAVEEHNPNCPAHDAQH